MTSNTNNNISSNHTSPSRQHITTNKYPNPNQQPKLKLTLNNQAATQTNKIKQSIGINN